MKPEKVIRDGLVAALYSPGYGAGWSTWNHDEELCEFLLFDQALVEMKERGATEEEVKDFLTSIGANENQYIATGGWDDVEIYWVEEGQSFRVTEYDGFEGIKFYDPSDYYEA